MEENKIKIFKDESDQNGIFLPLTENGLNSEILCKYLFNSELLSVEMLSNSL